VGSKEIPHNRGFFLMEPPQFQANAWLLSLRSPPWGRADQSVTHVV